MYEDVSKYYRLLGIPPHASLDEIRKAYRDKAKQFHPDLNKSPGAHEQFIAIGEAYSVLTDLRTGKTVLRAGGVKNNDIREDERKKARQRAAEHARMRYEEFLQSDYYKATNTISAVLDLFILLCVLAITVAVTIFVFRTVAAIVLVFEAIALVISVAWAWQKGGERIQRYKDAATYLVKWKWFYLAVFSVFNIVVFFRIGLATLIPLDVLLLSYLSVGCIAFVSYRLRGYKNVLVTYALAPLLVNLLLLVNYCFSSHPVTEKYLFHLDSESTIIHFDQELYEEYVGIRVFWSYPEIRSADAIIYMMEDGALGFRVMKGYRFISEGP